MRTKLNKYNENRTIFKKKINNKITIFILLILCLVVIVCGHRAKFEFVT